MRGAFVSLRILFIIFSSQLVHFLVGVLQAVCLYSVAISDILGSDTAAQITHLCAVTVGRSVQGPYRAIVYPGRDITLCMYRHVSHSRRMHVSFGSVLRRPHHTVHWISPIYPVN